MATSTPERADEAWEELEPAPRALTEVAAAAFRDLVWVVGGLDAGGQPVADVLHYEPGTDAWTAGPSLSQGVHHTTVVATDDALYVLGGYTAPFTGGELGPSSGVWRIDAADGAWEAAPPLPEPRGAGAAAWDGTRLVFGGGVGPDGVADEVWALEGGVWRSIDALSTPREHLAAASDGQGRVWFLAGRAVSLAENLGTVDFVEDGRVRELAHVTPRSGIGAFWWTPLGACVAGGETTGGTLASVECVDADGAVTELPSLAVPRHGVGAAVLDGVAYVVLGGREPGLFVSDVAEALDLEP